MSELPPTPENILWDLVESEADEKYFLDTYKKDAELPAILVIGPYSPFSFGSRWTVFLGRGIGHWFFRSKKGAIEQVMKIIRSAKFKVYPRMVTRQGKTIRLNTGYPIESESSEKEKVG